MYLPFVLPRWAIPSARLEALPTEPPFFIAIDGGIGLALAGGTDPGLPTRGTGVVGRTGGGGVVGTGITRGFVPSNGPTPFGMLGRGGVGVVGRGGVVVDCGGSGAVLSFIGPCIHFFSAAFITDCGVPGANFMIFPLALPSRQ